MDDTVHTLAGGATVRTVTRALASLRFRRSGTTTDERE
jgi:hypothetical protein